MNSDRSERVFLVRLWREGDSTATWRGSVHDVSLGPKRYITATQEIAEFVTLRLAATEESDGARAVTKGDEALAQRRERPGMESDDAPR